MWKDKCLLVSALFAWKLSRLTISLYSVYIHVQLFLSKLYLDFLFPNFFFVPFSCLWHVKLDLVCISSIHVLILQEKKEKEKKKCVHCSIFFHLCSTSIALEFYNVIVELFRTKITTAHIYSHLDGFTRWLLTMETGCIRLK